MDQYRVKEKIVFYDSQKYQRATIEKILKDGWYWLLTESFEKVKAFHKDLRKIDPAKTVWNNDDALKKVIGSHGRRGWLKTNGHALVIVWEKILEEQVVGPEELVQGLDAIYHISKPLSLFGYKAGDDIALKADPKVTGWIVSCGSRTCCVNWHGTGGQSVIEQSAIVKLEPECSELEPECSELDQGSSVHIENKFADYGNFNDGDRVRLIADGTIGTIERAQTGLIMKYVIDGHDYQRFCFSNEIEPYYCTDKSEKEPYYCTDKSEKEPYYCTDKSESSTDKSKSNQEIVYLYLTELRLDGGTQQRVKTDLNHVQTLEDALEENAELDPIEVIQDDEENNWVVDGFHRVLAYKHQERDCIPCHISKGTQRDAILRSIGANAQQKTLPRTRADKNKAVKALLMDREWSQWSDREIAKIASVSHPTVAAIRKSMVNLPSTEKRKFTSKHGTTGIRKVNTQFEDGDYGTRGAAQEKPWNREHFGETPREVEENGQGSVFFDNSIEPPDPDDFPTKEKYEEAHQKFEEKQPPKPTKDDETIAREVVIGIVSNLEILSKEQLVFVRKQSSVRLKNKYEKEWLDNVKRDFYQEVSKYTLNELRGLMKILAAEIEVQKLLEADEVKNNADAEALVS